MARPREFDPDELLQTAIELFCEKGYCDSSVDEVVRRSGVAKYGIYGTFGTKEELFKRALKQYASDRHHDIQAPIRKPGASLPEIRQFFKQAVKLMTQDHERHGCLIVNTGVELASRDPKIRDFVKRFFKDLASVMEGCLRRAVEKGELDASTEIRALANYLITEFRAALMLSTSGHTRREIQAHLDMSLKMLH